VDVYETAYFKYRSLLYNVPIIHDMASLEFVVYRHSPMVHILAQKYKACKQMKRETHQGFITPPCLHVY